MPHNENQLDYAEAFQAEFLTSLARIFSTEKRIGFYPGYGDIETNSHGPHGIGVDIGTDSYDANDGFSRHGYWVSAGLHQRDNESPVDWTSFTRLTYAPNYSEEEHANGIEIPYYELISLLNVPAQSATAFAELVVAGVRSHMDRNFEPPVSHDWL